MGSTKDAEITEHEHQVPDIAEVEDKTSMKDHWKCLAACTLVTMCPFQYGIDFGLIGGLQAMDGFLEVYGYMEPGTNPPVWNISTQRQQLISSLMILGAFLSSGSAGAISKFLGRRDCIWAAIIICCVANIIMMTTTHISALYVARLIIGLSNGMFMTFSQLYIQETAPAKYRGLMISVFQIWTSVGTLVGTVVDNFTAPLAGKRSYIIPLGIIFVIPGLLFFALFLIPESPRWLVQRGKDDQVLRSLCWHRPYAFDVVQKEALEIRQGLEAEKSNTTGYLDLFRDPIDRRRTILAVGALSTQGASGAMYMIAYGTYFFKVAGIGKSFENACILTAVGVVAILINSIVITKVGRRRVFLTIGLTIAGISQLLTAVIYTVKPGAKSTGNGIVAFAVIYIVGYNGMVSSYAWLSGGELPSQRLRSHTFGLATAIGFFLAWLATFTAPYFINPQSLNWGPKYGYIWLPSCLIAAAWIYFFLPEVKGRTLEEIDEMFHANLPARKFRKYKCVGIGHLSNAEKKHGIEKAEQTPWTGGAITAEAGTAIA